METKKLFTVDFYEKPELTLEALNWLVEGKHVAAQDMYEGGEFLYMEVCENKEVKNILSSVISDLESYKAYNNEYFVSFETTQIGLCALVDEYNHFFRDFEGNKEIRWNNDAKAFVFAENMPSKFD
ncbi:MULTISPECIES: hypothetical protein [Bacteroides]|uniref:hypothetical protein n=1 Tax=Bacteroides TaxID=816 RepID=UPI000E487454|nr:MULTISPECIES: hypothetical protein [Bacteroides]RHL10418.1 hypothetical protein DW036_07900 [Bacteroides sp. AF39-11AC]